MPYYNDVLSQRNLNIYIFMCIGTLFQYTSHQIMHLLYLDGDNIRK